MPLTPTFGPLLLRFRSVFTAPTSATSLHIAAGWCLAHRHRYVTELIPSAGAVPPGHHSRYHRSFANAAWSLDDLFATLAREAVATFVPEGTTIEAGVDDTLGRQRGLTIFGTGRHHDPLISSRQRVHVRWGHDGVILWRLVPNPSWSPTEVGAVPVGVRRSRNRQGLTKGKRGPARVKKGKRRPPDPNHRTRPERAVERIERFATRFPRRAIVVSGDGADGGKSAWRPLPGDVDLIRRVASDAAPDEPAPPRLPKPRGPSRKKGARLPGMAEWAADATPRQEWEFDRYGRHAKRKVKTIRALSDKAGKDRRLRIVLVRDTAGGRPDPMSSRTRTDWDARAIRSHSANRGSVEVRHSHAQPMMGLEDPSNRTPRAVERTAPVGRARDGLRLVGFDRDGHRSVSFPDRPWYPGQEEPSDADIRTALRRESGRGQFAGGDWNREGQETPLAQLVEFVSRAA